MKKKRTYLEYVNRTVHDKIVYKLKRALVETQPTADIERELG